MSDEKPLHALVAEALGWTSLEIVGRILLPGTPWGYKGYPPGPPVIGHKEPVPRYDTDWAATGPLIEKYGLMIWPTRAAMPPIEHPWAAELMPVGAEVGEGWHTGLTPLIAVCNLILALSAAGKLDK